ncbi:MAG: CBS domain-containing protein [Thermoplasmatota archaeon]
MARIDDFRVKDIMSKEVFTAEAKETVSDAIGLMKKHNISEIPIVEEGEIIGLISDDKFIERRHLPFSTKLRHVLSNPPNIQEDDTIVELCEMLLSSGYRGLPVSSNDGDLVGFVSRTDIVSIIPEIDELSDIDVNEVMTPSPTTVSEREAIGKAKSLMKKLDERVLPVVDKHGHLSGMVGVKDIVNGGTWPIEREEKGERRGERDSPYDNMEIQSLMNTPPVKIYPKDSVKKAAGKMNDYNISTLVAAENSKIKGIITQYDLVELITTFRESEQVYVQITGLEASPEMYDQMYNLVQKYLSKINKVLKPLVLNIHVVTHKKEGNETKYSIRLRLNTDYGMFYANKYDWNIMKALDDSLESVRKKVFQKKDKWVTNKKHPKYIRG